MYIECDFLYKSVQDSLAAHFFAFKPVGVRTYNLTVSHLNILLAGRE